MLKTYHYYLTHNSETIYEYECYNKDDKKEMEDDVVHSVFPNDLYCMREKFIDGKRIYCNKFHLKQRRENPYFINNHKL